MQTSSETSSRKSSRARGSCSRNRSGDQVIFALIQKIRLTRQQKTQRTTACLESVMTRSRNQSATRQSEPSSRSGPPTGECESLTSDCASVSGRQTVKTADVGLVSPRTTSLSNNARLTSARRAADGGTIFIPVIRCTAKKWNSQCQREQGHEGPHDAGWSWVD